MTMEAVNQYLMKTLLDADFRELALRKKGESFTQFDLSEDERRILSTFDQSIFDRFREINGDTERLGIAFTRVFVRTERTVERVAMVPNWKSVQWSDKLVSDRQNAVKTRVEHALAVGPDERLAALTDLLDEIDPPTNKLGNLEPLTPPHGQDQPDIYIVGLGINGFDQVTPEVRRALSQSNETFYIGNGIGTGEFISSLSRKATNLISHYTEDGDRLTTYRNMALQVVEAAMDHGPVALAEYGHPTMFAMPPFIIEELCEPLGLKLKVYPGISAMDCILADLMIDPCFDGMLMYEATDILVREREILPDTALLIWQAASVETTLYSNLSSRPERFFRLTQYLLKYYPADHEVVAIYSTNFPLVPSSVMRFPLGRLPELAEKLHPGYTLYLKPARIRQTANYELAHQAQSVEHLHRISSADRI